MRVSLTTLMVLCLSICAVAQQEKIVTYDFSGNKTVDGKQLGNAFDDCLKERDYVADDKESYLSCFDDVESLFWQEGYLRARVMLVSISEEGSRTVVSIEIDEGRKYNFDGFEFRFGYYSEELFEYVEALIPLKVGETSRIPKIGCYLTLPEEVRSDFPSDSVDVVPEFDDEAGTVRFAVFVSNFENVNFSRVEFIGNEQTRDRKIRRTFCYGEGALFSVERLEADVMRLNNARIVRQIDFERDVEVRIGDVPRAINVIIRMKEIK